MDHQNPPAQIACRFELPAEIWVNIFRLAAGGAFHNFDTSSLPPLSSGRRSWTPHASEYAEYAGRVRTRTHLVLVCKVWRTLALQLLYESVTLRKPRSLPAFVRALQSDMISTQNHNSNHPDRVIRSATWFIRRLEVHPEGYASRVDVDSLIIFRWLSNLRILVIVTEKAPMVSNIIAQQVLQSGCQLHHYQSDCYAQVYHDVLRAAASTLDVVSLNCKLRSTFSHFLPLSLPRVHTLEIRKIVNDDHSIVHWLSQCEFPALQRLLFEPKWTMTLEIDEADNPLKAFYTACGSTVTSLDVSYIKWTSNADFVYTLALFPHLREITIQYQFLNAPLGFDAHPWIVHDSLIQINLVMDYGSQSMLFSGLASLTAWWRDCMFTITHHFIDPASPPVNPSLKCVRLLDFNPVNFRKPRWALAHINIWQEWVDQFKAANVRFEFSTGDLVVIPDDIETYDSDEEDVALAALGMGDQAA
jgi:hypothetical protein